MRVARHKKQDFILLYIDESLIFFYKQVLESVTTQTLSDPSESSSHVRIGRLRENSHLK